MDFPPVPIMSHQFLIPDARTCAAENWNKDQKLISSFGDEFFQARSFDTNTNAFDQTRFGVLTVETPAKNDLIRTDQINHWVLNLDRSGSMDDLCNDGKTKLQHLKHMLKNLVHYLKSITNSTNHNFLSVIIFDHEAETICEHIDLNDENSENIYTTYIDSIESRGATNFENAFDHYNNLISKYPNNESAIHLFMTDGMITCGNYNSTYLINKQNEGANPLSHIYFIGFGIDHNAKLLQEFTNEINSANYYFIESLENAGLVYGEIVHEIIYECLHTITIHVDNGEIYNYLTNTWEHSLSIASLPFEASKNYHIRSPWILSNTTPLERSFKATIVATRPIFNNATQRYNETLINMHSHYKFIPIENYPNKDVEKFWWRQSTLELLYIAKTEYNNDRHTLRSKLTTFLDNMKAWSNARDFDADSFVQDLCDDIYATIKGISTANAYSTIGYTYINARQSSQGLQRAYNIRDFSHLERSTSTSTQVSTHIPSLSRHTSYASQTQRDIMRSVSESASQIYSRPRTGIPVNLYVDENNKTQEY